MLETKILELRDRGTFLPVAAILIIAEDTNACAIENLAEHYLTVRAGYSQNPCILLTPLHGGDYAQCDPYGWSRGHSRTMAPAHAYIAEHWSDLTSGDVIDIEFILGETLAPKVPERFTNGE